MDLSPELVVIVSHYGYWAVFAGSLLEGDALLVVASFLSYLGKMDLPMVMLAAFFGTWLSDVIWFMLGRYSNSTLLAHWHWLHRLSSHSVAIVAKRPRLMALTVRFMYGLRMIIPFSLGKSSMSTSTFMTYNALGVLIWVGVFSAIGYFFAGIAESLFGRIRHLEIVVPVLVVATLLCFIYASHIFEYILKIYPKKQSH